MSNLKKEYEELIEKRKDIIKEIKLLEESEVVKRHLELTKQNEDLYNQQRNLYKDIKEEEYSSCQHILVESKTDYEGSAYRSRGCVKCGLDNRVLGRAVEDLFSYEKIMYNHLRKNPLNGIETKIVCDLDLAQAIYSKIKEAHPDIDDQTAIKYLETALDDIRNIKVSEERKTSRAKRLSLRENFNRWNREDVYHG